MDKLQAALSYDQPVQLNRDHNSTWRNRLMKKKTDVLLAKIIRGNTTFLGVLFKLTFSLKLSFNLDLGLM